MNSSHWKAIVAVVLLLGAAGIWWFYNHGSTGMPDRVRYVDMETGEPVWIRLSQTPNEMPGENPKTGKRTLLPVTERDGRLYADPHYAVSALRNSEVAKLNKHIDPTTMELIDVQQ